MQKYYIYYDFTNYDDFNPDMKLGIGPKNPDYVPPPRKKNLGKKKETLWDIVKMSWIPVTGMGLFLYQIWKLYKHEREVQRLRDLTDQPPFPPLRDDIK